MGFDTIEINLICKILQKELTNNLAVRQIVAYHREGKLPVVEDVLHLAEHTELQYHVFGKVNVHLIWAEKCNL